MGVLEVGQESSSVCVCVCVCARVHMHLHPQVTLLGDQLALGLMILLCWAPIAQLSLIHGARGPASVAPEHEVLSLSIPPSN